MATIFWEEPVAASVEAAWSALREVGRAHLLFAPVLVDGSIEGNVRSVRFANGLSVDELIVSVDDGLRRVGYSVLGDMFDYHFASMQVVPADESHCRFIWISDFLPDTLAETIRPLVEQGSRALAAISSARSSRNRIANPRKSSAPAARCSGRA